VDGLRTALVVVVSPARRLCVEERVDARLRAVQDALDWRLGTDVWEAVREALLAVETYRNVKHFAKRPTPEQRAIYAATVAVQDLWEGYEPFDEGHP